MQDARKTSRSGGSNQWRRIAPILAGGLTAAWTLTGFSASAAAPSAASSSSAATETAVRVFASAVVTADEVTLADVGEVRGETTPLAAGWPIMAAPEVGSERVITLEQIQTALRRRGINLANWVFRGSTTCRVSRPSLAPLPAAAVEEPREGANGKNLSASSVNRRSRPGEDSLHHTFTVDRLTTPSASARNVDPNSLEGAIQLHVADRLADLGGSPSIRFSPSLSRILALSKPTYDFRITDRGDRRLGLLPLEITIYEGGRVHQVVPALVEVSLIKPVVVAATAINRGQIVHAENLALQEKEFNRPEDIGPGNPEAFVGQRAKRFHDRGDVVEPRDLEPVPLVERNDLVTVWSRRGGVRIKSVAKAMGAASYGGTIELRSEISKRVFLAVVTGPRSAEVVNSQIVGAAPAAQILAGGVQ